jgi:hypothetical protein
MKFTFINGPYDGLVQEVDDSVCELKFAHMVRVNEGKPGMWVDIYRREEANLHFVESVYDPEDEDDYEREEETCSSNIKTS